MSQETRITIILEKEYNYFISTQKDTKNNKREEKRTYELSSILEESNYDEVIEKIEKFVKEL